MENGGCKGEHTSRQAFISENMQGTDCARANNHKWMSPPLLLPPLPPLPPPQPLLPLPRLSLWPLPLPLLPPLQLLLSPPLSLSLFFQASASFAAGWGLMCCRPEPEGMQIIMIVDRFLLLEGWHCFPLLFWLAWLA